MYHKHQNIEDRVAIFYCCWWNKIALQISCGTSEFFSTVHDKNDLAFNNVVIVSHYETFSMELSCSLGLQIFLNDGLQEMTTCAKLPNIPIYFSEIPLFELKGKKKHESRMVKYYNAYKGSAYCLKASSTGVNLFSYTAYSCLNPFSLTFK